MGQPSGGCAGMSVDSSNKAVSVSAGVAEIALGVVRGTVTGDTGVATSRFLSTGMQEESSSNHDTINQPRRRTIIRTP